MNLKSTGANYDLSWTVPSINFVWQQSSDLTGWSDVANPPVLNLTNLQNEVVLSTGSRGFYRLKRRDIFRRGICEPRIPLRGNLFRVSWNSAL